MTFILLLVILSSVKLNHLTLKVIYLLERTIEITLLYDYYGELLTERQQEILRLYYFHDLSLGEISEKLDISRQGVYDHLHRSEKLLHQYENQLELASKFKNHRNKLDKLFQHVKEVVSDNSEKEKILKEINNLKEQL